MLPHYRMGGKGKRGKILIEEAALPGFGERQAQAAAAHAALVALGYQPVGLDHYARPDDQLVAKSGRLQRNFQGYTDDDADALVGLGASAISRLPQGFAQNAPAVGNYARAVAAGKLATVKGIALSDDDRGKAIAIDHGGLHVGRCDLAQIFRNRRNRRDRDPEPVQLMTSRASREPPHRIEEQLATM